MDLIAPSCLYGTGRRAQAAEPARISAHPARRNRFKVVVFMVQVACLIGHLAIGPNDLGDERFSKERRAVIHAAARPLVELVGQGKLPVLDEVGFAPPNYRERLVAFRRLNRQGVRLQVNRLNDPAQLACSRWTRPSVSRGKTEHCR